MIHNVPQPMYEEYVAEKARVNGLIEIRKNHSFVKLEDVCLRLSG